MELGKVVEYDEPFLLLVNDLEDKVITRNGAFAKMLLDTGEENSISLFYSAKNAY